MQILSGLQAQLQQESDSGSAKQQSVYLEHVEAQWRTMETGVGPGNSAGTAALPTPDQELDSAARVNWTTFSLSLHRTPSGCAEGQRADCKDGETEAAGRGRNAASPAERTRTIPSTRAALQEWK